MLNTHGANWQSMGSLAPKTYLCGHSNCGTTVSSERGWFYAGNSTPANILICPSCKQPTFFDEKAAIQIPGVVVGSEVKDLPENIRALWQEIRTCTGIGSHTAAVLTGRTLLMHIAVEQKAPTGKTFLNYVDYLVDNHFAPPNSKVWVDRVRAHGNEATHEIVLKSPNDSKEIIVFLEMLLKFIYEFPNL